MMPPTGTDHEIYQTRSRLHQRLARAHQKEHVQDLGAKVRTHEQNNVRATKDVQEKARNIVKDNLILRQLLSEVTGFSVDEIKACLLRGSLSQLRKAW